MFEKLAVGSSKQKTGQLVVYGIVVNVGAVNESDGFIGVDERFVVAGNNLGDGNLVATVQITLGDA